jgi:hypothetical protein
VTIAMGQPQIEAANFTTLSSCGSPVMENNWNSSMAASRCASDLEAVGGGFGPLVAMGLRSLLLGNSPRSKDMAKGNPL